MVAGAFTGWLAVYAGAPLWVGVGVAALTGAAFGLLHALPDGGPGAVAARVGPGHHAAGDRAQLLRLPRELPEGEHAADHHAVRADGLAAVPILAAQTPLTLLALLLVPRLGWVLYRTPAGLALRMVGENPQAAEGQGVSVAATRTGAIVAGSALMGVAGSFLTLSAFNAFFFNMVNGRGWICVALVVFASWRPGKALLGALLFAFFDALQLRLQQIGRCRAALPALPDAALPAVDPGAGAGGAQGQLSAGADETVPQRRTLR
jgi:ABC-type uncharacterized transport system permease subunit